MREQFFLPINRDVTLNCFIWSPDEPEQAKAIIQLAHGMAEHILRYDHFANHLASLGYIVCGNDHRGHGRSIMAPDDKGFFSDKDGFQKVVQDMHALTNEIKNKHPDLPVFLFGHSMGSFLSRRYIQLYGDELAGVILSGTGFDQGFMGKIGIQIAKWDARRIGPRTPSKLMNKLSFGSFNKNFAPVRTEFDFLTRDEKVVDHYIADPDCGFIPSTRFYADLLTGIAIIHQEQEIARIPKDLPIYLIAGDLDPVGDNGKGVLKVYEQYKQAGLRHIEIKLYPGARHEILNEWNKEEVYEDVTNWLDTSMQRYSTN